MLLSRLTGIDSSWNKLEGSYSCMLACWTKKLKCLCLFIGARPMAIYWRESGIRKLRALHFPLQVYMQERDMLLFIAHGAMFELRERERGYFLTREAHMHLRAATAPS